MTIDEAIKLQQELIESLPEIGFQKYIKSTNLGIEALKRVKDYHRLYIHVCFPAMPGETE